MTRGSAAVLTEFRKPMKLQEYPLPARLEPQSALVKINAAGICGTDVHLWKGEVQIPLPVILGHETVGTILELGSDLKTDYVGNDLETGDRVTWSSALFCGTCYYCRLVKQPTRCLNRRAYGINLSCDQSPHFLGGYADHIYLKPGTALFRIPDELPTDTVAGAGCALVTAIHGIERIGVDWGDKVVVQGSGPVGLSALAIARDKGAAEITVVGGPEARLSLAKKFGADSVINIEQIAEPTARIREVRNLTGGYGADIVLECTGIPTVVPEGLEMCRDSGRYLVLGHYADTGTVPLNPHTITRKQLQIFGSWSSEPRHMWKAINFLKGKREMFPFENLVSHKFRLDEANEALESMAKWAAIKPVITP